MDRILIMRTINGDASLNNNYRRCHHADGYYFFTPMISVQQVRKTHPEFNDLTDEEMQAVLKDLYDLGSLALECWVATKSSKFPKGLLSNRNNTNKINL
jgi:hypothetical protein